MPHHELRYVKLAAGQKKCADLKINLIFKSAHHQIFKFVLQTKRGFHLINIVKLFPGK